MKQFYAKKPQNPWIIFGIEIYLQKGFKKYLPYLLFQFLQYKYVKTKYSSIKCIFGNYLI